MVDELKRWKRAGLTAAYLIVLMLPAYFLFEQLTFSEDKQTALQEEATYVGRSTCDECHKHECTSFQGSHHDLAMDAATDSTVLGDFNNATLEWNGVKSLFYRKDGKFMVHTAGVGGKPSDFEITFVFGVTPLQQYLVPFEGGRLQCLPLAWDSQKKLWFHLVPAMYPNEDIAPDNWLYWTNQGQNWNSMCADCHSTNLKKGYDMNTDTYNTTYSEIDVSCEACHGPASGHIAWARLPESSRLKNTNYGLVVNTSDMTAHQVVDHCARCHARRTSLKDFDASDEHLLDYMLPVCLRQGLYQADGQVLDEDYIYGSFLQSKMYKNNVKCNDCHDVHRAALKQEGNRVCTQCHLASEYDTYAHHHHKSTGPGNTVKSANGKVWDVGTGAQCVNCHMPGRFYMGNDFRHDHSMRVPRPDLSAEIGTSNACNDCHSDQSFQWAAGSVAQWHGKPYKPHFGTVFHAARQVKPEAEAELIRLINEDLTPSIVRASAVELLNPYQSAAKDSAIRRSLEHFDPLVRQTSVNMFVASDAKDYVHTISPLLYDRVRSVRMQAARSLTQVPLTALPPEDKKAFDKALNEYIQWQQYLGDFPSARFNLGNMYANLGQTDQAIEHYKAAIRQDNRFTQAMVNLAALYNGKQQNDAAERLLKRAIELNPELWSAYYSLGLLEGEMQKYPEAVAYLKIAQEHIPNNPRISYNLGLICDMLGQSGEAEAAMLNAHAAQPDNQDYLNALISFYLKQNNFEKALFYSKEFLKYYPDNQEVKQLISKLQ